MQTQHHQQNNIMMLAARFQPRLQATVSSRRNNTGRRMLPVVAFKNGDEEQQATANAKVTFQLPLHGKRVGQACFHEPHP